MPRRRNRRKNRRRAARRSTGQASMRSGFEEKSLIVSRDPGTALHDLMRAVTVPIEEKGGWLNIGKKGDEKDPEPIVKLRLLRTLFKPDSPYRCTLGMSTTLVTAASGVLAQTVTVASVSSSTEWSAIDQLFDEVFVHSMRVHFMPHNIMGGGMGAVSAGSGASILTRTTPVTLVNNAGLQAVSLFNGASGYSSAGAMLPNPTLRHFHTSAPFDYYWRNNVKFDPRGLVAQNTAWQGWTLIGNITNYGGTVQFRVPNDQVLGDAINAVTLGIINVFYDVSFRSRA